MRQASRVANPTAPAIGNCTSAQESASVRITKRAATRLATKPTKMAERQNRKKKLDPTSSNCFGVSARSCMIGTAARPRTALSAKLINILINM